MYTSITIRRVSASESGCSDRKTTGRSIGGIGMVPITPLSTLVVYPLTSMPALEVKHCWLIVNLGLHFALCIFYVF